MAPQPFVPLADGCQVELKSLLFGEVVENRLWFRTRFDPISPALVTALAIGVGNWYVAQVLPSLSQDLQFYNAAATDWTAFPTPFGYQHVYAASGGTLSASHSANVSVRVRFKGDSSQTFPDNSNFVPGIPLASVVGNNPTNTIKTALRNAYINLIDLCFHFEPSHNWEWCVTSRRVDYAYRTEQLSARTDFISIPSPTVSPRRRRLPR
jgi:hypothetical protein